MSLQWFIYDILKVFEIVYGIYTFLEQVFNQLDIFGDQFLLNIYLKIGVVLEDEFLVNIYSHQFMLLDRISRDLIDCFDQLLVED